MGGGLPRRGSILVPALAGIVLAGVPAGDCRAVGELYPEPPAGMSEDYRASTRRCPRPADPRKNAMDCRLDWFDAALAAATEFWASTRDALQLAGVTPRASLYGSFFVGSGGPVSDPMFGGTLSLSLAVDVGKLAGAPKGLGFYVSGLGGWSKEPWPLPVSVNYNGTNAWLTELYVQQSLLDGALVLAAGRLQPAMTFAFLPVMLNHVGPVLMAGWLTFDEPPFPPGVASQWGVQGVWTIAHQFQVSRGVYDNNPYSARGDLHGFAWQFQQGNTGVYAMAQASWLPGAKPGADELPGLARRQRLPGPGRGRGLVRQLRLLRPGAADAAAARRAGERPRPHRVGPAHLDASCGREPDAARRDGWPELAWIHRGASEGHRLAGRIRRPVLPVTAGKPRPRGARAHLRPRPHRRLLRSRRPPGDLQRERGRRSERIRRRSSTRAQPVRASVDAITSNRRIRVALSAGSAWGGAGCNPRRRHRGCRPDRAQGARRGVGAPCNCALSSRADSPSQPRS
jgi:hypothetical protein